MNQESSAIWMKPGWSPVSLLLLLCVQALVVFMKGFLCASVCVFEFFLFLFRKPPLLCGFVWGLFHLRKLCLNSSFVCGAEGLGEMKHFRGSPGCLGQEGKERNPMAHARLMIILHVRTL